MEEVKIEETVAEAPVEEVSNVDTETLFVPHRMQGESFEDYKERRLVARFKQKMITGGRLIWNSRPDPKQKGSTYRKPVEA